MDSKLRLKKLLWFSGRLVTWVTAVLAAGQLADAMVLAIKTDLAQAKQAPITEEDTLFHLGVLVSWVESFEESLDAGERAKIKAILKEIKESQKEFFEE